MAGFVELLLPVVKCVDRDRGRVCGGLVLWAMLGSPPA